MRNHLFLIEMSVQATIPFKHRKRTCLNNDENNDLSNINYVPKERALKRSLRDRKIKIDDDDSSKVKKSKSSKNTTDDRAAEVCSSLNDESPKILKPLTSREMEIERLENFLNEHLENEESASIYVSGQPGTGKTASLSYILQQPKIKEGFKQVYINCTMMKSAASIYSRVCKELGLKMTATTEKACVKAIEKYLQKTHKMILLVLDELDQLDSKRQSVLYSIFEWPVLPNSRIVLVGVANALDLTERTLPRLQARCSLKPHTLHFAPYTKEQIIKIFVAVLANDDKANVFSPVALQMLAAKIAAVSGDMRRALDIGRRVIEVANRNRFAENKSVDSLLRDSSVTVELKEVLQVLNNVYGGSTNIGSEVDEGLPMQQKLILCSLILMLNKGKNTDILMGKLHEVYKKVAASRNIAALGLSELCGACSLLEARGAVRVCAGAGRARRLRLHWDLPELQAALADKPLLAEILRHAA